MEGNKFEGRYIKWIRFTLRVVVDSYWMRLIASRRDVNVNFKYNKIMRCDKKIFVSFIWTRESMVLPDVIPIACLSTAGFELDFMTGCIGMFCPVWGVLRLLLWLGVSVALAPIALRLCSRTESWLLSDWASWFSLVDEPSSSSSLDDELFIDMYIYDK